MPRKTTGKIEEIEVGYNNSLKAQDWQDIAHTVANKINELVAAVNELKGRRMSKSQYTCILMWLTLIASKLMTDDIASAIISIASVAFGVLTLIIIFKGGEE